MARKITVLIQETVAYRKEYAEEKLAALGLDVSGMDDDEVGDFLDGDTRIEDDLQHDGDVQSSTWQILIEEDE